MIRKTLTILSLIGLVLLRRERGAAQRRVQGNMVGFASSAVLLLVTWSQGWAPELAISMMMWTGGTATAVVSITADRHMLPAAGLVLAGAGATLLFPGFVWEIAASAVTLAAITAVVSELFRSSVR